MNDDYSLKEKNVFYIVENILGPAEQSLEYERLFIDFNSQVEEYCNCDKVCSEATCKCIQKSLGENYTVNRQNRVLKYLLKEQKESTPIFECNKNCLCSQDCGNRVVQQGPIEGLKVEPCNKGLGLYTTCFIPRRTFVCEYAGELITRSQAAVRHQMNKAAGKMNYIFCLKEHSSGNVVETYVDPSGFGNIGRYINHSCEPNCHIVPVRCDSVVPKLAIFASVDILPEEELTFNYGSSEANSSDAGNRTKCLCNSVSCNGFMPFHSY